MVPGEVFDAVRGSAIARGISACVVLYWLLWAYNRRDFLSLRSLFVLKWAMGSLATLGLVVCVYRVVTNLLAPRDWDFFCFWIYGRALALGHSPYNVEVLREIAAPHAPSEEFRALISCNYPPVCLPLFWPLGYFTVTTAMSLWYAMQIGSLAGCIVLLRRYFDEAKTWHGLLLTLVIVLTWHSTSSTLHFAQTNLLLLMAILLFVAATSETMQGIWLGLAIAIKPIALILALSLLSRRRWQFLAVVLLPLSMAFGLFLLAQGWSGVLYYANHNPLAGEIAFQFYVEPINESLLSVLLRFFAPPPLVKPVLFWPFVLVGSLLTIITLAALVRAPKPFDQLGVGYVVTLALLLYPGTLEHYSLLLLVPVGLLWQNRASFLGGPEVTTLVIAVTYGLVWSRWSFAAHLLMWVAFTACCAWSCINDARSTQLPVPQPVA